MGSGPSKSIADFYNILVNPEEKNHPYTIIDVRTTPEVEALNVSTVLGDRNLRKITYIPLKQLQTYTTQAQLQHKVPAGIPVLCLCRSGVRSSKARGHLKKLGYEAFNVEGGMNSFSYYKDH